MKFEKPTSEPLLKHVLRGLDDLGLGDETRQAFLHDNALTAFGL